MERSSLCVCFFFLRALFYLAANVLLVHKGSFVRRLVVHRKLHVVFDWLARFIKN